MTVDDVIQRVAEIEARKSDDEMAHSEEDRLRKDVLEAIAEGAENARELAAAALETGAIDFARWCA